MKFGMNTEMRWCEMKTVLCLMCLAGVAAINNGLGRTPAMGYNTWYIPSAGIRAPAGWQLFVDGEDGDEF